MKKMLCLLAVMIAILPACNTDEYPLYESTQHPVQFSFGENTWYNTEGSAPAPEIVEVRYDDKYRPTYLLFTTPLNTSDYRYYQMQIGTDYPWNMYKDCIYGGQACEILRGDVGQIGLEGDKLPEGDVQVRLRALHIDWPGTTAGSTYIDTRLASQWSNYFIIKNNGEGSNGNEDEKSTYRYKLSIHSPILYKGEVVSGTIKCTGSKNYDGSFSFQHSNRSIAPETYSSEQTFELEKENSYVFEILSTYTVDGKKMGDKTYYIVIDGDWKDRSDAIHINKYDFNI